MTCRHDSIRILGSISAAIALLAIASASATGAETPGVKLLAGGMTNPESVAVGGDGRLYVTVIGEFDTDGDGSLVVVENGQAKTFAKGLDDPKGLIAWQGKFYVADKKRIWQIDEKGKARVYAAAKDFPRPPLFLNDLVIDDRGTLYVADSGDLKGTGGAIFAVPAPNKVRLVADSKTIPKLGAPNGLWLDDKDHLLLADFFSGEISRVNIADGKAQRVCGGFDGADGLARDKNGKLYITQWTSGLVSVLGKQTLSPSLLPGQYEASADICFSADGKELLVPDMKAGTLSAISLADVPAAQIDETPLALKPVRRFANLSFQRPLVLTHAGDGSNRVFVLSQLGKIFVFPNDQDVSAATEFLDIEKLITYKDSENEEGLLGLAFHPNFKQNGELFVYYVTADEPHTSVVNRFRVSKDDPNRVDPASKEELLRVPQPFWNHKGGTLAFGPDGYLYIVLGDGGKANDPFGNGQNLRTLLGSVLRIDVDHKGTDKAGQPLPYAIPKDNPFVAYPHARPEIWAYGVRNPWRLSFDRQTGECWLADVGQDLWEEVNVVTAGANCGWNVREGKHPFGIGGIQQPREDILEPIFEYSHDIGKSITGGHVYRGKELPQLAGAYLYADYVTGMLWALQFEPKTKAITGVRPIPGNIEPVFSFGEAEDGEVYFMTTKGWIMGFGKE